MGCPDGGEQSLVKMTDAGELKEKKAMIKKAVIFDADGTLWDSVDLVAKAFSIKLQDFPETKGIRISREDLLPLMGKTMDQFAKSLIPQVEGKRGEEILGYCMQFENFYLSENKVQFYPHLE